MNCENVRRHWHLFHDSEGDAELHHQINEHLAMCPECSRWYFQQSRLEDALTEKLRVGQPTPALWDRVRAHCVDQPTAARSWPFSRGSLLLAAVVLMTAVGLTWFAFFGDPRFEAAADLASRSADLHEKLTTGREALKLYSDSPQEVEDYVRARVSFPVRCPPREDAGFQVAGGGVCHFDNDPVAYVVGDVDGERVSVFIMDRNSVVNYPAQDKALRRQGALTERRGNSHVVIGQLDRNVILVVGPVDSGRLTRVLRAYGSYPHHEAGAALPYDLNKSPRMRGAEWHQPNATTYSAGRAMTVVVANKVAGDSKHESHNLTSCGWITAGVAKQGVCRG